MINDNDDDDDDDDDDNGAILLCLTLRTKPKAHTKERRQSDERAVTETT